MTFPGLRGRRQYRLVSLTGQSAKVDRWLIQLVHERCLNRHEHSAMKERDDRVPNLWSLSAPIDTSLIALAKV